MSMMNSRKKNPPRSKKRAQGRSGRQKAERARLPETPERWLSSPVHGDKDTKHSKRHSEATGTPLRNKTGLARSTSPKVVNEDSSRRSHEKTSESGRSDEGYIVQINEGGTDQSIAEHDVPSLPQRSLPESFKAATPGQVVDPPQAMPHSSALPGNKEPRLQHQHGGTKADRDEEKWKAKKTIAVAKLKRATNATKKEKAKLDRAVERAKLNVEKAIKAGEAKVNHATVVIQTTEARIDKIVKAGNAKVGQAIRAGDAKIDRARKALHIAKANKDLARDVLQEVLAMQPTATGERGDAQTADRDGNSNSDSESDSSE
ncbi:MAG: hypothetical protein L6R42_002986 [Xanthoria sp. 1 TBL-2021]|nr:MAG: hypothetical protein L6R42_002986 [Xanthoria sp. 1 TBL-2021]